jgi:2-polyprenyl-6-hydroxyphenyl methylase/3-demethylubiquinone-9 3-methyltransferase
LSDYYSRQLSGERLRLCYEIAPPRVRRYLEAEIEFLRGMLEPDLRVLELGCGYGRVLHALSQEGARLTGIDTSAESLALARRLASKRSIPSLARMDALRLGFRPGAFDLVCCVQNGICAFNVDPLALMREALRVARRGGLALFSSYSSCFWEPRLNWFRLQAAAGLLGEIDEAATGEGVIACKDGFRSGILDEAGFAALAAACGVVAQIIEVEASSLFCVLQA